MKCYKLVFGNKYFNKNIGSIIVLVFIICNFIFIIYYLLKGISPIREELAKFISDEKNPKVNDEINIINPLLTIDKKNKNKKSKKFESKNIKLNINSTENPNKDQKLKSSKNKFYPPKKSKILKDSINNIENKKETDNLKLIDIVGPKKTVKVIKKKKIKKLKKNLVKKVLQNANIDLESIKSDKFRKRKSIIDYANEKEERMKKEKILIESSNNILIKKEVKDNELNKDEVKDKEKKKKGRSLKNKKQSLKDNMDLNNYELNHLDYEEAIKSDKREFCDIYWSILKREQLILFTFLPGKDFNLFYIKMVRLFFIIISLMSMNVFLFADKSIHNLFINGIKYDFVQQILQIILSVLITNVIDILLCFLSLTDRDIYKIKALQKTEIKNITIYNLTKKIRIKLIIFLALTFIILFFYWYIVSAFCSVYNNTQGIYIIDCVLSIIFFMVIPFIVYGLKSLFRIISLKKKIKVLYKLSQVFPIF